MYKTARWIRSPEIMGLLAVGAGLAVVYSLATAGHDILDRQLGRHYGPKIVMNPDSTQFAYALDYSFNPEWLDNRPAKARVEIWTYDLSRMKGPRLIGGWHHDPKVDARLLQWTAKGLYLSYSSNRPTYRHDAVCDLVDPKSGSRVAIGAAPLDELRRERRAGPDPNNFEEYARTPHIEEHNEEFFRWDPSTFKLIRLFALPIDPNGPDPNGTYLMQRRAIVLRQDGFQQIERVEATGTAEGVLVRVHTFARRTAPFTRRYRLHLEVASDENGENANETTVGPTALWDTLVTPNPARDVIEARVPYTRFWKAIRPERELIRRYGHTYHSNLYASMIPDSLAGDAGIAPGIRKGIPWGSYWAEVAIPLP